ncbi:DUF2934 domain-containing protein [Aureimonas sp. ME7]|uniref:DUF2934 domain-containing protein n=1 Tax=Aureimonas sp. ME7 TaxID=2744252 RepID=UPI0015F3EF09|nr:DUF2934 domain-containing protein [Aureimonas sp. ME7]
MTSDKDQEIRNLAYFLWEKAGRPAGQEHDFWAEAAKQVEGDSDVKKDDVGQENRFIAR